MKEGEEERERKRERERERERERDRQRERGRERKRMRERVDRQTESRNIEVRPGLVKNYPRARHKILYTLCPTNNEQLLSIKLFRSCQAVNEMQKINHEMNEKGLQRNPTQ